MPILSEYDSDIINEEFEMKMVTTSAVSKEIQRRLEVDPILFDDHELRCLINLGFDWLVENRYFDEIFLN